MRRRLFLTAMAGSIAVPVVASAQDAGQLRGNVVGGDPILPPALYRLEPYCPMCGSALAGPNEAFFPPSTKDYVVRCGCGIDVQAAFFEGGGYDDALMG